MEQKLKLLIIRFKKIEPLTESPIDKAIGSNTLC